MHQLSNITLLLFLPLFFFPQQRLATPFPKILTDHPPVFPHPHTCTIPTGGAIVTRVAVTLAVSATVSGIETLGGMVTMAMERSTAGIFVTAETLGPFAASC